MGVEITSYGLCTRPMTGADAQRSRALAGERAVSRRLGRGPAESEAARAGIDGAFGTVGRDRRRPRPLQGNGDCVRAQKKLSMAGTGPRMAGWRALGIDLPRIDIALLRFDWGGGP